MNPRSAFGEVVRGELTERPPRRRCCCGALLCGIFRHAGTFELSGEGVAVRAELGDAAAARLAFRLVRDLGGDGQLVSFREPRFARGTRVLLRLQGDRSLQLLHEVGVLSTALGPLSEPPRRLLQRRCCRAAYLRGAFVAAGSVSAPRAAGHLEIRAPEPEGAGLVRRVARADGLALHVSVRRGHAVAYAKSKQTIRELLAHMGAHDAVLSLDEAEVISRTRERANRATNCDEANLARQGSAARAQTEAIARLDIDTLGARLRQVAELRAAHPDLSLAELGRLARPPLSKSTVAGRMRLLVSAAEAAAMPAGGRRSGGSS
ncbi:MAG TPA: DNA-binding protein WhiA [Gaiellales bacterium]